MGGWYGVWGNPTTHQTPTQQNPQTIDTTVLEPEQTLARPQLREHASVPAVQITASHRPRSGEADRGEVGFFAVRGVELGCEVAAQDSQDADGC